MSLWTNDSSVDLYAGSQPPLPGSNFSSNRTDGSQHRGHHGAAPLDLTRAVPVGMVLASFIMFAIVGNILVILSVVCNRHLRIPTNYFIINLAIADLLLGTTVLPVSATLEVLDYWVFGRIFCDIWAAVDVLCCTASIMSLCVISIDRYIGVRYPLQYPTIVTEKRALLAMLGVWILAIVISIGPLLGWKQPPSQDDTTCQITEEPFYTLFSSLGSFYIPLAVILAMYCRVYVVAKRTTKNLEAGVMRERQEDSNELTLRIHCRNQQVHELCPGASAGRSTLSVKLLKFSREKKAAKTLGVVVGMFILCWLPFFLVLPLGSFNSSLRPPETFFKVIFWLGYFNSCLNPIIYPCYSREFKQAFIRILRCRWKRRRQWQAYYNYRCQQGSNTSSFLNGSQQTLSSVSPSPRCVASRLRPPPWPSASSADRDLLPGSAGRGRPGPVSPLAKDAGTVPQAVMNGRREERHGAGAGTPPSKL
ncbi:alpha-1A adrenergic receptor-like [Seriola lalandi dorsalis]|uniref:alpha-1A adrenergic receptor-like n=1 Tax=Seriola lalandi dorsalis TaxID=1841481 RepID=UPI000C6FC827|nr:alpha-1A adrenergic receptor-like [Seriola lalandi dorsalis]XP_056253432.1 alpha-1A adrenergic receptor-like [Seriola aureovittata]